jgi:hypothetical protein
MATLAHPTLATDRPAPVRSVGQIQADRLMPELAILSAASLFFTIFYWAGFYRPMAIFIPLLFIVVMAIANFRMIAADPVASRNILNHCFFTSSVGNYSLTYSPVK